MRASRPSGDAWGVFASGQLSRTGHAHPEQNGARSLACNQSIANDWFLSGPKPRSAGNRTRVSRVGGGYATTIPLTDCVFSDGKWCNHVYMVLNCRRSGEPELPASSGRRRAVCRARPPILRRRPACCSVPSCSPPTPTGAGEPFFSSSSRTTAAGQLPHPTRRSQKRHRGRPSFPSPPAATATASSGGATPVRGAGTLSCPPPPAARSPPPRSVIPSKPAARSLQPSLTEQNYHSTQSSCHRAYS